jgi:hypothetical protein
MYPKKQNALAGRALPEKASEFLLFPAIACYSLSDPTQMFDSFLTEAHNNIAIDDRDST